MNDILPSQPVHGRGAVSKGDGRFERYVRQSTDDGWLQDALLEEEAFQSKLKTTLHLDTSRTVLNDITSPDLPFMRSLNPYKGCEHGCVYCYARPTHSYLGLSAGLDFETEIFYKPDAPDILRKELSSRKYRVQPITLGSNTDCYQPLERNLNLTRRILEVLHETSHPLIVITKSALVVRDLDLLAPMAEKNLVRVNISLTTLEADLARTLEPRAAAPHRRLATIKALADAGIPVTVMVAPMIPGLNDMELESLLDAAYVAGARQAHYTLVRLPYEVKDLFREWLLTHRPDRAARVLSLIKQTRDGKLYDANYSQRRTGTGAYADLLAHRFALACKRKGYATEQYELCRDLFRPPLEESRQGQLFE